MRRIRPVEASFCACTYRRARPMALKWAILSSRIRQSLSRRRAHSWRKSSGPAFRWAAMAFISWKLAWLSRMAGRKCLPSPVSSGRFFALASGRLAAARAVSPAFIRYSAWGTFFRLSNSRRKEIGRRRPERLACKSTL